MAGADNDDDNDRKDVELREDTKQSKRETCIRWDAVAELAMATDTILAEVSGSLERQCCVALDSKR